MMKSLVLFSCLTVVVQAEHGPDPLFVSPHKGRFTPASPLHTASLAEIHEEAADLLDVAPPKGQFPIEEVIPEATPFAQRDALTRPARPLPLSRAVPVHRASPAHHSEVLIGPEINVAPVYQFGYGVADDVYGAKFAHNEKRDNYKTTGEYRVALPDGRIQIVRYSVADAHSGYVADVKYEGEAKYEPYQPTKALLKPIHAPAP